MHRTATRLLTAALLLFVAVPAFAVTYIVPSDREMIQRSDDIVIATGVTSTVERTARGGIVTKYILRIEEVLKGDRRAGKHLILTEIGGQLADLGLYVSGMPVYEPGERYLVFSDSNKDGEPRTFGLELGQFYLNKNDEGRLLALRSASGFNQNLEPFSEGLRDARGFIEYIRGIVAQRIDPNPTYFLQRVSMNNEVVEHGPGFTRASYLLSNDPRHPGTPAASLVTAGTQGTLDGVGAVNNAISAWNGTNSSINYTYAGQDNSATGGFLSHDFKDGVLFNDPNDEVSPPVIARGGFWSTGATHSAGSESGFRSIDGGVDVVVDNLVSTNGCLLDAMTHELGHTLGFRHSNEGKSSPSACPSGFDCTSNAIMNSSVSCTTNGALRPWDNAAAETVYGAGPVCNPPAISQHPQNVTITQGQSTTLSVTATNAVSYQWYTGNSGDTSSPITGATTSTLNRNPSTTTSYWVRVLGCNSTSADSNTATVTVNPPVCTPPAISTHPLSVTITQGNSTTLTVSASGSGTLSYQWYIGTSGNTSNPTGTNSSSLLVNPSATTSYWVRVTGCEGNSVNSNTATVTVNPAVCVPPAIASHPQSTSILEGQSTALSVNVTGTGPFTYQWFIGNPSAPPSTPTGTNSPTLIVSPTATTSYWVRVTGQCDPAASSTAATVTVTVNTCPDVSVGAPTSTNLNNGTYRLDVSASGAGSGVLTYQWFQGTAPGLGTFIGIGQQIIVPSPATPTSYWVRVSNNCGKQANSPTVVTISPGCDAPVITTQPIDQTIANGASATLSLVFTSATTGTVRWYRGAAPDKSNQIGTGISVSTGALTATTQFFASITNTCGAETFSRTLTVTVGPACTAPVILATTPAQATKIKGETVTLNVVASGTATLDYQWYEGTTGDTSKPVGTNSATFTSVPLTASTRFWVRVTNGCGNASSNTIVVDVRTPRRRAARH